MLDSRAAPKAPVARELGAVRGRGPRRRPALQLGAGPGRTPGNHDTATLPETLTMAAEQVEAVQPDGSDVEEVVADKGYHSEAA